jgi:hypothetical protein
MAFEEIFWGFLIALGAGALIGLQRQQSRGEEQGPGVGGVRTFPLIALAGALSAFIAHTMGMWPMLGAMVIIGAFLAVSQYQESSRSADPGVTTQVAALITFLLGVLALAPGIPLPVGDRYLLIVASAGVVMGLLSFKEPLHQAVARISDDDLYATAKFVVLAVVILPLLPNRTYGPFNVLNPFHVALMVVLIAGVVFSGTSRCGLPARVTACWQPACWADWCPQQPSRSAWRRGHGNHRRRSRSPPWRRCWLRAPCFSACSS